MSSFCFLLVFLLPILVWSQDSSPDCSSIAVSEEEVLKQVLSNYSKQARPRRNASETVLVQVGLELFAIRQFNERENVLTLAGYVSMLWDDDYFQWSDKFPYNCLSYLYFDADLVWCPNLSFMSGFMGSDPTIFPAKGTKVSATSDGGMELYPMGEISIKCEIDLQWYPFDEQICTVILESWSYPNTMQQLVLFQPQNTSAFMRTDNIWIENEEWEVMANDSVIVHPIYFPNNSQVFDRALFKLLLKRKNVFYRVHVIVPGLIIGIVEVVTFVLPVAEVIKVHISFTCLLAYSVYQNMVMNEIPKSQTVPLLSILITLQMGYIGGIAILGSGVVFLILRQAKYGKPPPKWLFGIIRIVGLVVFHECNEINRMRERKKKMQAQHKAANSSTVLRSMNYQMTTNNNSSHSDLLTTDYGGGAHPNGIVNNGRSLSSSSEVPHNTEANNNNNSSSSSGQPHFTDTLSSRERWVYMAEVVERCNMWLYIGAVTLTPVYMFTAVSDYKQFNSNAQH